ncbi:MAG: DUF1080 domain-containing protein [Tannerellaceae bacterium]|jgi:hypothetical protein|nr:DUF1080 domain-containing protein [Tannerellaceae bacterium]
MKRCIILTAVVTALFCAGNGAMAQKTEKLFNGKDLLNWNFILADNNVPADRVYYVQNGVIHIAGSPLGYMYTAEKYGDCRLHVEWRWPDEATNSGIFLLIEDPKTPFPNGIECQLAAGNAGDLVLLGGSDLAEFQIRPGTPRPGFPSVKKANPSSEKPAGEWNEANIFIKDGTLTIYINGVYQNTGTNKVKSGHIGLQSEGKDIEFRNLTVTK